MKRLLVPVILFAVLVSSAAARAETLDEKEARLADLKAQVAKLEAEVAADKAAGGGGGGKADDTMENKLATLPKELYPAADESSVKRDMRNDWVDKNTRGVFGPWTFTGKVTHFDTVTRTVENPAPGAPDSKKMIEVDLSCPEPADVWGCKISEVRVEACLDYDVAVQSLSWKTDGSTVLTVSGKTEFTSLPATSGDWIGIKIEQGTLGK